jgi:hypothetical protein
MGRQGEQNGLSDERHRNSRQKIYARAVRELKIRNALIQ